MRYKGVEILSMRKGMFFIVFFKTREAGFKTLREAILAINDELVKGEKENDT